MSQFLLLYIFRHQRFALELRLKLWHVKFDDLVFSSTAHTSKSVTKNRFSSILFYNKSTNYPTKLAKTLIH